MASPQAYLDDDLGRWGSPRLCADVSELPGKPTRALRHRKPSESSARRMHLYIVVAACHDARLSSKIVGEALGISDRHVRRLYRLKAKADASRKG